MSSKFGLYQAKPKTKRQQRSDEDSEVVFVTTKNNQIGSWLIRFGLCEPASHFAICFPNDKVVHSHITGIMVQELGTFLSHNEFVAVYSEDFTDDEIAALWNSLVVESEGKPYDFKAFAYWVYCVIRKAVTGKKIPARNAWGSDDAFLCTGIASLIPKFIIGNMPQDKAEMFTPTKLLLLIRDRLSARDRE